MEPAVENLIPATIKCALSLAVGLAAGFASAKAARTMGYVVGLPLLVASVAGALDVCPVDLPALLPRAADPLREAISLAADAAIDWIGTYVTEPENARYLGPAAAGFFLGMAVA